MSHTPSSPAASIRSMVDADCTIIAQAFAQQGWHKTVEQYQGYLQEAREGKRDLLVAEVDGKFAGYLTIVWASEYTPFREAAIPEIVDLNVLEKFQRKGIASALMDAAESRMAERSPVAGIGVGLMPDYGPAQVMYIRRGYVPDGRGVVSHGKHIVYGMSVPVDDDLVLYMTRPL